ncbi:phage tail protein I [Asticcacaulis solisilvae]|uniref:phage tail protein I n=1 Tax=Asticcacaulis solisilvae TaxID=1217274 RepID=UPI003FD7E509
MSLLPPNATALERAFEGAIQAPALDVPLRQLWDPDTCPVELLPWLVWGLSIDNWDTTWSEAEKRQRARTAILDQMRKGSRGAVDTEIAALGGHVTVTEWWEQTPAGDPFTFELALDIDNPAVPNTAAYIDQVLDRLARIRRLAAHAVVKQKVSAAGQVGEIGAARAATYARLDTVSPAKDLVYLTGADGAQLVNAYGNEFVGA